MLATSCGFAFDQFLRRFPIRTVGATLHQEYWIPAAELEEFNGEIDGLIESIARFGRSGS